MVFTFKARYDHRYTFGKITLTILKEFALTCPNVAVNAEGIDVYINKSIKTIVPVLPVIVFAVAVHN